MSQGPFTTTDRQVVERLTSRTDVLRARVVGMRLTRPHALTNLTHARTSPDISDARIVLVLGVTTRVGTVRIRNMGVGLPNPVVDSRCLVIDESRPSSGNDLKRWNGRQSATGSTRTRLVHSPLRDGEPGRPSRSNLLLLDIPQLC